MENKIKSTILEAVNGSNEGRLHFGQVVGLLTEAGVESYVADYRAQRTTHYLPDGQVVEVDMQGGRVDIAQAFDAAGQGCHPRGAGRQSHVPGLQAPDAGGGLHRLHGLDRGTPRDLLRTQRRDPRREVSRLKN